MNVYSVIDMDIVNSRKIQNRKEINIQLENYFKKLQAKYNKSLVSPITFTMGDEWQIVLRDIEVSYNLSTIIKRFLKNFNVECYCGIGVGTISTSEDVDTRKMDGKAFIYAREAINIAKSNKKFYLKNVYTKDCKVVFKGEKLKRNNFNMDEVAVTSEININNEINYEKIINSIIQNNEALENKFTYKQRNIIELYEQFKSYNKIQHEYPDISKSNISRKITSSNYLLTIHNRDVISELLNIYGNILKVK